MGVLKLPSQLCTIVWLAFYPTWEQFQLGGKTAIDLVAYKTLEKAVVQLIEIIGPYSPGEITALAMCT